MELGELLATGQPIVADGGMGTMLISMGLIQGDSPELWNIEHPDRIRSVHRSYIEAGAQIILTNSFGGNRIRLGALADRCQELNLAAAKLARMEVDDTDAPVVVGGSIGPTGELMEPLGTLKMEAAIDVFAEQAEALLAGGVDVLWIETMSDLNEVQAAIAGCRRIKLDVPIVATMTFDTKGRTMMGVKPEQALEAIRELGVLALGGNCGNGPAEIEGVIEKLHAADPTVPLVAKSNAGLPQMVDGVAVYNAEPEEMAAYARRVRQKGATIIGACCGSTPAHIQAIAQEIQS